MFCIYIEIQINSLFAFRALSLALWIFFPLQVIKALKAPVSSFLTSALSEIHFTSTFQISCKISLMALAKSKLFEIGKEMLETLVPA